MRLRGVAGSIEPVFKVDWMASVTEKWELERRKQRNMIAS